VPGAEKETVIQKKQDEKVHFEGSNAIREKWPSFISLQSASPNSQAPRGDDWRLHGYEFNFRL